MGILRLLADDLRKEAVARAGHAGTMRARLRYLADEVGLRAVMLHRAASRLADAGVPLVPTLLAQLNVTLHGIDIEHGATIGYRVHIPHPVGVVIGSGCVVEDDCLILAGVTLGQRLTPGRPDGFPRICRGAMLGTKTTVLGPMIVGEHSHVGANSVVTSDVAPWSTVAGAPARVVSENRRSAT
jgi:serine O-acetyltransferase